MTKSPTLFRLAFAAILLTSVLRPAGPAAAQEETLRIAAVVNDQMISVYDLAVRTEFVITTSGQESTEAARRRLAPEVLRQLIDEALQLEEAKAKSVTVTDAEVSQSIAQIEEGNRIPPGTLARMLTQRGLPQTTLTNQIRARLVWQKLVAKEIHQTGAISDEDIDQVVERIRANRGKPEYAVAEIVLTIDRPESEPQIQASAQRLVEQVRQGGNFGALAQQLSDSSVPVNGGDLGWVQTGQLDPELDAALPGLAPGQVSDPIRTLTGYHVLLLRDRRVSGSENDVSRTRIEVSRLLVPVAAGASEADVATARAKAVKASAAVKSCADLEKSARDAGLAAVTNSGSVTLSALPPRTAQAVATLKPGQLTEPLRGDEGFAVLMVCQRAEDNTGEPNREDIRRQLFVERLETFGRRYLRDLRQAAYIDVRR